MKKNYFSRLWLLVIFCCMAITSQAQTVKIAGHTSIGTFQGYPLFYVTTKIITVSPSHGGSFNHVYIDDAEVTYNSSSYYYSYALDVTPYYLLDGEIHKLQLKSGSSNYGVCYITSNKDYKELFVDGIHYSIEDETAKVTGALSEIENAIIPETYTKDGVTYPVVEIAYRAFGENANLKTVTIPNSIKSIGNSAFYNCSGLTSITIGNSVTSIGSEAFRYCSNLNKVIVSDLAAWCSISFAGFDSNPLYNAPHLYSDEETEITDLIIPNGVTSIGNYAFSHCSSLISATIPNSVESIGESAFSGCFIIKAFWLGNTPPSGYSNVDARVNYVSNNQYWLSNQLQYPFLSSMFTVDGIVYIPVSPSDRTCDVVDCIYSDENKDVTISSKVINKGVEMSVIDIKPYAFYYNDYIQSLNLSNAGQIESYAFYDCDSLQTADIANTGDIGSQAFYDCSNLQTANIANTGDIGSQAFYNCSNLQTATLGESVTGILSSAFYGCSDLPEMTIPNSVTSLGESTFYGCSSLESVSIGRGVPSLPKNVFYGCSSLSSLYIPNNITSIGDYAFQRCSSLSDVFIENAKKSDDVLVLGSNGKNPLFSDCPLDEVYIGRKLSYQASSIYGYSPFYCNTSLRTVEITDAETEIYDNEFYGCSNLTSLKIGNGVTTIGNWAFSGCSSLDYFSAGSHVESIGKEAFSDCTGLTKYYSFSVVPPTCGDQALDDINKWECTLYVPNESSDEYQAASQWKDFFFVEEMDDAADISDIESDASPISIEARDGVITIKGKRPQDLVSIYNSQGGLVEATTADTITLSQHGIFIVRIGNYTQKIIL